MRNGLSIAGLVAGVFFASPLSQATTFGPIPVVDQAENSQYIARGTIEGHSWTEMEPHSQRPYTYWRVNIESQTIGDRLAEQITVRQPGGEIGPLGYHMAGTADFANGEDTFLFLRDTNQGPNVKELVGLASGKYRVETNAQGEKTVMSGLGLPVTGDDGHMFSPDEFTALLQRVNRHQATPQDRNVFVNRAPVHEREETAQAVPYRLRLPASSSAGAKSEPPRPADPFAGTNAVQQNPAPTEKNPTGSSVGSWVIAAAVVLGLLIALLLVLRRE